MRDHGGDIDKAAHRFGRDDWIDLSTGINRRPWPVGTITEHALTALPTGAAYLRLQEVAGLAFGCPPEQVAPLAGASAAIQILPRLLAPEGHAGRAAVLSPSYNEHAASLRASGWEVAEPVTIAALYGADLAVVVNPNNPDGRCWQPSDLAALAREVGHLVVDESFADPRPELSLIPILPENVTVLRSFGKFWGLAGLRLGFAVTQSALLRRIADHAGPWSVSGPALEIGAAALADHDWARDTVVWLAEAAVHLDQIMTAQGCTLVGGTHLFRLYETADAAALQERLARHAIWSRIFPYNPRWLRLGLPGSRAEFGRLREVFNA